MSATDFVTILTAAGKQLMTKRVIRGADGRAVLRDYDNAKHFEFVAAEVAGLDDLARLLDSLGSNSCVVRGRLADGVNGHHARRILYPDPKTGEPPTLQPAAHHWLPIDLDSVDCPCGLDPVADPERAADHVVDELLPAEMLGADAYWQLTSGAGFKPGIRLRLVFWCDRTLSDAEARRWLGSCRGVDASIYTGNQPIYFARPVFDGVADPVPRRSGIRRGDRHLVSPPSSIPDLPRPGASAAGAGRVGRNGIGYEAWRRRIGDHAEGEGFFEPIKSAAASWIASNGAKADTGSLCKDLEKAIREAVRDPAAHPDSYIEKRVRDLDSLIPRIVAMQAAEEAGRKPELKVQLGDLPATAREVRDLLAASARLFDRGSLPVKLVDALPGALPIIVRLTAHSVVTEAHRRCQPFVWNDRKGKWVMATLPDRVAKLYLDMTAEWDLLPLDGIATAPLLAADGGIRAAEGYDPATRLWCCNVPALALPERPTRDDADAALLTLRRAFRTFPAADAGTWHDPDIGVEVVDLETAAGRDESAILAAVLTAVCRPSLWLAPGFLVSAPDVSGAGTGKGLLVRAICAIAFGTRPRSFTAGGDATEMEKRIAAELIEAAPALFLDNVNAATLRSDMLASILTERPARVRVLGETRMVPINSAAFVAVTGNGLSVSEDLVRRFLFCSLDARVEEPERRPFRPGFLEEIERRRAEMLGAALTIWRWGRQSAETLKRGKSLGSFEQWAEWVRDPLLTLGCADPVERLDEVKASDPRRQRVGQLFQEWWLIHQDRPVKASELSEQLMAIIDPQGRGRQYIAARLGQLAGTRAAGFVLTREKGDGAWSAATYALKGPEEAELPLDWPGFDAP